MAKLNCPHCHQSLTFVLVTVTQAYQKWTVGDKTLTCSDTNVMENSEPRCWGCDGRVGAYLQEHGIACDWDKEAEKEMSECQHSSAT